MEKEKSFSHLHCHTHYSLLDGAQSPTELAQRAAEIGLKAVAITDHGRMGGIVEFYSACKKYGVKPIIGVEAYCCGYGRSRHERVDYYRQTKEYQGTPEFQRSNYHLIMLAKDAAGYRNILSMVSESYSSGYYFKPRIDYELLEKYHEGVIVSSACIIGEVSNRLLNNDYEGAKRVAAWFKDVFGDDYYLEVMNHDLDIEKAVMQPIRDLADELGIKTIVTNDAHYSKAEDHKIQKTLMLINMHKSWADSDVSGSFFGDDDVHQGEVTDEENDGESDPIFETSPTLYLRDYDEMVEANIVNGGENGRVQQELANTNEIADKCVFEMPMIDPEDTGAYLLPDYPIETDVLYGEYSKQEYAIPKDIEEECLKLLEETHGSVDGSHSLSDFMPQHDIEALRFLCWICEQNIDKLIRPKIEALGEPLPSSAWISNPPKGFSITHAHNSPDEKWIKGKIAEGLSPDDIIGIYRQRLAYEISVVCVKRFINYFLIVQSYIGYTRAMGSQVGPGRGCLTPDNEIICRSGVKTIDKVVVSDEVLDEKFEWKKVTRTFQYEVDEELRDITIYSVGHLKLTSDHKILVSKPTEYMEDVENISSVVRKQRSDMVTIAEAHWVEAAHVRPGDWVFLPKQAKGDCILGNSKVLSASRKSIDLGNCFALRVEDNKPYRYIGKVYDLMVDTDNEPSYVTTTCCVHNSGAGALLNYLTGITSVDPIPNDLMFERFISVDRVDYPDIDADWSADFRDNVLWPHLRKIYGYENTAGVAAYTYFWGKAAIKAAARVLFDTSRDRTLPASVRDEGKATSVRLGTTLADLIDNKPKLDLRNELDGSNQALLDLIKTDPKYQQVIDLALLLQGRVSGESQHASAYIISSKPLTDTVPMMVNKDERERIQLDADDDTPAKYLIQVEGSVLQNVGLVKLDLLSINDLEVIDKALENIEKTYGSKINIENIPLDDKSTFDIVAAGHNTGIFQFDGSPVAGRLLKEMKADNINDWSMVNALNRPGSLLIGMDKQAVEGKLHPETIHYFTPAAEKYLHDTYGVAAYQESLMLLSQDKEIIGLTPAASNHMRKILAKKKKEQVPALLEEMHEVANQNGVNSKVVDDFCEMAMASASYSFNKSHSLAYAIIAYRGAFLKTHFPECYLSALSQIKPQMKGKDKIPDYLEEARQLGVVIKPPHVNYSDVGFSVPEPHVIAYGLNRIKGVGAAADTIIAERDANGSFTDLTDFCCRVPRSVTKTALSALISAGALDGLGWTRKAMEESIDDIVEFRQSWFKEQSTRNNRFDVSALSASDGTFDLFGGGGFSTAPTDDAGNGDSDSKQSFKQITYEDGSVHNDHGVLLAPPHDVEYTQRALLRLEKKAFGMYFSGSPEDYTQITRRWYEEQAMREHEDAAKTGKPLEYKLISVCDVPTLPNNMKVELFARVEDITPKHGGTRGYRMFRSGKGANVFLCDWGRDEESRFGFSPTLYRTSLTCFERTWNSMDRPVPDGIMHIRGRISVSEDFPTSVVCDWCELLPEDAVFTRGREEIAARIQGELKTEREKMSDPGSDAYLVMCLQFDSDEKFNAFKADAEVGRRFALKNGKVVLRSGSGADGRHEEVAHLKATMGLARYALDKYGVKATRVRLPKARMEVERRF